MDTLRCRSVIYLRRWSLSDTCRGRYERGLGIGRVARGLEITLQISEEKLTISYQYLFMQPPVKAKKISGEKEEQQTSRRRTR